MREGAIPTLNLPQKSLAILPSITLPRPTAAIEKRALAGTSATSLIPSKYFKDFNDFIKRTKDLKLKGWSLTINDSSVEISKENDDDELYLIPEIQIFTDNTLSIVLRVYGWVLAAQHYLLACVSNSFYNVTPTDFFKAIAVYKLCIGIDTPEVSNKIFPDM